MKIKSLSPNIVIPTKSRAQSGAYDLYMPESGAINGHAPTMINLGFAAAIPEGFVGLLLPRSGVGAKKGVELNNTCGVIDADYRGEWIAALKTKGLYDTFTWNKGERILQVLFVPVLHIDAFTLVDDLDETERGEGSFGSSGQ